MTQMNMNLLCSYFLSAEPGQPAGLTRVSINIWQPRSIDPLAPIEKGKVSSKENNLENTLIYY